MSNSRIVNLKQYFILVFLKKSTEMTKHTKRFLSKGMTHAKPIHMAMTALYQNDVQYGDKRIPFKTVKCM